MPISGALEVTIKINSFPSDAKTVENGLKQFDIDTGDQTVTVKINSQVFRKLEQAQANYSQWVAAIAGKMGERTEKGFILTEANIQLIFRSSLG